VKQQKANLLRSENYRPRAGAKDSSHLLLAAAVACIVSGLTACAAGSEIGSIGAVLGRDAESNELYVREVASSAPSTPGLMVGDEIVMIDGVFVRGLSKNDLRLAMRGQVGSTVRVTVVRGAEVEHLTLKRSAIKAGVLPRREERISEQ
jgi:C-terminal processing protease CtpA/Prc